MASTLSLEDEAMDVARRAIDRARRGDVAGPGTALGLGLPSDARTSSGNTLLMPAAYHGHHEAARLPLARGVSPEISNDRGQSPLAARRASGVLWYP